MQKKGNLPRKQVKILDINVDSTNEDEVLKIIGQKVAKRQQTYIVTPNPEIALQAQNDKLLAEIINRADICVPDGSGFRLVDPKLQIIHGRNLMLAMLELANRLNLKIFFITSNRYSVGKRLANRLAEQYPGIKSKSVVGPQIGMQGQPVTEVDSKVNKDIVSKINSFKPDLLFVCFGQVKQEKWIAKNLASLEATVAIGVGGAIDYFAGVKPLPPKWMEALELEWLWRVFSEGNLSRVLRAVILFPLNVFLRNLFRK